MGSGSFVYSHSLIVQKLLHMMEVVASLVAFKLYLIT